MVKLKHVHLVARNLKIKNCESFPANYGPTSVKHFHLEQFAIYGIHEWISKDECQPLRMAGP